MRPHPPHPPSLGHEGLAKTTLTLAATLVACGMACPALAQDTTTPSARYLDWSGRPAPSYASTTPTPPETGIPALRRPGTIIPHAGTDSLASVPPLRPAARPRPTSTGADGRPGLTPASAFFTPAPASSPYAVPTMTTVTVASPAAVSAPRAPAPVPPPQAMPTPAPAVPMPAPPLSAPPSPAASTPPTRPESWADDPMAPRADAPIWSLARNADTSRTAAGSASSEPTPAPPAASSAPRPYAPSSQQTPRYYSVHRQNGRQPDRPVLPQPVYLNGAPIELEETPRTQSLSQPPEPPALVRNPDGTVRRTIMDSSRP